MILCFQCKKEVTEEEVKHQRVDCNLCHLMERLACMEATSNSLSHSLARGTIDFKEATESLRVEL